MLLLLPFALPGALLHLPVGWVAATVGERFSYEQDDIATLKVFASILLLPLLYLVVAVVIGFQFGFWWALLAILILPLSFFSSVQIVEAEISIFVSLLSLFRLKRLGGQLDSLRSKRAELVQKVREMVDRRADPELPRYFDSDRESDKT